MKRWLGIGLLGLTAWPAAYLLAAVGVHFSTALLWRTAWCGSHCDITPIQFSTDGWPLAVALLLGPVVWLAAIWRMAKSAPARDLSNSRTPAPATVLFLVFLGVFAVSVWMTWHAKIHYW
jgi:hypothetical protein